MQKADLCRAALLFVLLIPCGIANAQLQKPANTLPLIAPQVAPTVATWTSPGKILLVVDTVSQLNADEQDDVTPNRPAVPDADRTTPERVAAANGYKIMWFGNVMAIAPATTTVLHADIDLLNLPLSSLAMAHPMAFLLTSLNQSQFDVLRTTGLGMDDLTPDQQTLFRAINPVSLNIVSSDINFNDLWNANIDTTLDWRKGFAEVMSQYNGLMVKLPIDQVIGQLRLHAYLHQTYSFAPITGEPSDPLDNISIDMTQHTGEHNTGSMKIAEDQDNESGKVPAKVYLKNLLVSQEPNNGKPSDLDWKMPILASPVHVSNLRSVDALVNVLAGATHLELYADSSYGPDSIYIGGDLNAPQSAGSLMRALALCVAGTWRKVGPAYVLTDDLAGLGARQLFISGVVASWQARMDQVTGNVSGRLAQFNWQSTLPNFPTDTDELSPSDAAKFCTRNHNMDGSIHWSDLPPALRSDFIEELTTPDYVDDDGNTITSAKPHMQPDAKVTLLLDIEMAWELPGQGIMSSQILDFHPEDYLDMETSKNPAASPTKPEPITVHAVICAPKIPDEAVKAVDLLPGLGMNTLIIDVFNNGRTYFPSTAIPPESSDAAGVLKAAIDEAAAKHIAVYAAVDLLCWRKDGAAKTSAPWPSKVKPDINVFGEPSDVGYRRILQADEIVPLWLASKHNVHEYPQDESWVSPSDPIVRSVLPEMIGNLARVPGLSGLVLQNTAGPGYTYYSSLVVPSLGFTLDNRLAYLRLAHVDPIDIRTIGGASIGEPIGGFFVSLHVPGFHTPVLTTAPSQVTSWGTFKKNADLSLLKACFDAAKNANPGLPLLIRDQADWMTIDIWKDPSIVSFARRDDHKYAYIDSSTIMDVPVMKLLGQDTPLPAAIEEFCKANSNGRAGGIALDIEDGAINQSVPVLLRRLKPLLNSK